MLSKYILRSRNRYFKNETFVLHISLFFHFFLAFFGHLLYFNAYLNILRLNYLNLANSKYYLKIKTEKLSIFMFSFHTDTVNSCMISITSIPQWSINNNGCSIALDISVILRALLWYEAFCRAYFAVFQSIFRRFLGHRNQDPSDRHGFLRDESTVSIT